MGKHFFSLCLLLLATACQYHTTGDSRPGTSRYFYQDSARIFGRFAALCNEQKYDESTACFDSLFSLPVADADHPDALTVEEMRRLCARAINEIMVNYNITGNYQQGYHHLDSIGKLNHPVLSRHCRRELWVAKSQMLMALGRPAETLDYLNRAMELQGENDDPESEIFCTSAAGITYMGVDTTSTRAEQAFVRANAAVKRAGGTRVGCYPMAVGKLADIYLRQGKFEECIAFSREAEQIGDSASGAWLFAAENLMNAYTALGQNDEALRYCRMGTEARVPKGRNNLIGRFFRTKADIYGSMNQPDSALRAYRQADSCFATLGSEALRLKLSLHRAHYLSQLPDSLEAAIEILSELVPLIPEQYAAYSHCFYAQALARAGRWAEALPWFQSGIRKAGGVDMLLCAEAAGGLVQCYIKLGKKDKLLEVLPRYHALQDSVSDREKVRQLASANIRFETQKKEEENRALTAEVKLQSASLRTYTAIGICLLLLAVGIGVWFVMRHRNLSLRLSLKEQQQLMADERLHQQEAKLHQLITSRQELNERNRELIRQLSEIQAAHANTCELDRVMESLQSRLLTREEEYHFRASFSALYPSALTRLREVCPNVTRSEELYCMFVFLNLTNEEQARTLGISAASVSKTRYRLKLKLEISEGGDVDAEVKRMMQG